VIEPSEVWNRVDKSVLVYGRTAPASSTASSQKKSDEERQVTKRRWRRQRRWLDVASLAFWTYVVVKVFFFDLDRWILQSISPNAVRLLNYRIFFYIFVLIGVTLILRVRAFVALGYVALFPLIAVLWKFPLFVYRQGRRIPVVAVVTIIVNLWLNLRFTIVTKGIALFAALGIILSHSAILVLPCAAYLIGILVVSFWRTVRASLSKSPLMQLHAELIENLGETIPNSSILDPEMLRDDIALYSKSQVDQFLKNLTSVVIMNRALYYWAYQLDRYRETAASLVFGALNYILLFLGTVSVFTLLNTGLMHLRPQEFQVADGVPGLLRIALYSMSSIVLSAGAGIESIGNWASLIRIGEGFIGMVLLAGLLLNIVTALRADRDAIDARRAVTGLKARAAEQERRLKAQLHVSIEEALSRLKNLGDDVGWIRYMTRSIPPDFYDHGS
jgi:hypothetical protein